MRTFGRTALAVVSAAALLALGSSPARAGGGSYVALGDSYSSGTGTRSSLHDGTSCQRSVYAYPELVANSAGYRLDFRACGGATVSDVLSTQLDDLSPTTAYVTITVGGNDADFSTVLSRCALPAWASNCNGAIDRAQRIISAQLPSRLTSLFAAIRGDAPHARVVAVGYPHLFNGQDCNALTWFSPTEEARLNATADLLDGRLQAAAGVAGFTFASPTAPFVGHAICGSPEWVNGLSNPTSESYHPNRLGHSAGFAPLVGPP